MTESPHERPAEPASPPAAAPVRERSLSEALVDESPDALIALSPNGVVLSWNRGAATIFGYDDAEVLGRRLDELVVPPELRHEAARHLEQTLNEGSAVFETRRRRSDGSFVEVDVSMRRVANASGEVDFVAVNEKDITDIKPLRSALVVEDQFRALLESAPDAMVIVDEGGRIVLVNAQTEKLFGYGREDLVGETIEVLVPGRYRARHPSERSGYFRAPRPRPMGGGIDLYGRKRDGSEFPAEISLAPIHTPGGTLVTAAVRDITDRKRLEDSRRRSLEEASRLKSEFLANMSHELRTPLNAIIGFAKLMYHGKVGPLAEPHREYLGDILTSSNHLLQLINDVLDLSKVEAGRMEFHPEALDLPRIIGEVRDILRAMATSKQIQVDVRVDEGAVDVELDPSKLKQVLYNFLSNALKFTDDGGTVTIRALAPDDATVRIEVEDSGIGIREEDVAKLFSAFQQLDSGTAKKYQGTGLGLALTRRIVEAQGGTVGVTSMVGRGSRFFAVLPRRSVLVSSAGEEA